MTVDPTPRRRLPRLRWRVPLLAFGLWAGVVFGAQRHLLFPGRHLDVPTVQLSLPAGGEQLWIETPDARVEAFYLPAASASAATPAPLLVVAHGNAELIDHFLPLMTDFTSHGLGVLLIEYPGFGRSEGAPTEASVSETFVAAFDQVTARPEVDATRVVGLGRSLGGGAVCALARQRDLAALVLSSTFTSVRAFAGQYFLPAFAVLDPFDNQAALADFAGPVLLFHGEQDDVVPYEQALANVAAAADATLVTWPCHHNDCPPSWAGFHQAVVEWLVQRGVLAAG